MTRTAALNRVCVIGLDGVPCTLLEKLADEGVMPAVAELRGLVPLRRMRVSIPEISAVSWTSFATGANPGVHGIFGFVDLAPGGYQLRFPRFTDCRAATIWDKVGYAGGSSVVINQPFTYPARPLEGALVSGFVALDLEQSVYPTGLVPELERIGYAIDIDTSACREDHELLWRQLHETLEGRRRAVELLWPRDWTYFQAVVTGTDRLFHFLWDAVEDAEHAHHTAAMEYFLAIDRFIADTWERFRDGNGGDGAIERFFLISDHGFCGIRSEVYLNRWLQQEGYLRFGSDPPAGLEDMDPDSRAFCLDPGRIFINAADRFPAGSVPRGQVAALLEEIQTKLGNLQ
jgi:predicted AlkP superfamily phosphohydrolase/phosphomutase